MKHWIRFVTGWVDINDRARGYVRVRVPCARVSGVWAICQHPIRHTWMLVHRPSGLPVPSFDDLTWNEAQRGMGALAKMNAPKRWPLAGTPEAKALGAEARNRLHRAGFPIPPVGYAA